MSTVYKKCKDLQPDSPVLFFETFIYQNKTHYIICQTSQWEIGYMHGPAFNRVYREKGQDIITSFSLVINGMLLIGLKNGGIKYGFIEGIYNQIPLKKIQSVNGKSVLSIAGNFLNAQLCQIYTLDFANTFKLYENYKYKKEIKIISLIPGTNRIATKQTKNKFQPIWMLGDSDQKYPLLLSIAQLQSIFSETNLIPFQSLEALRSNSYYDDQKPCHLMTAMDFDIKKKLAAIGYQNGVVELFKIQETVQNGQSKFRLECFLKLKQKQQILSMNISHNDDYVAYLTDANGFFIDIQRRMLAGKKVKNSKQKHVNSIKLTIDNYHMLTTVNGDKQRLYCSGQRITQDIAE